MPRGIDYHNHPKKVMERKQPPCGRKDSKVVVMDHGNGFMFLGTSDLSQAGRVLCEYVDNPEDYCFAARPTGFTQKGRPVCAIWLSTEPLAQWNGP